MSVITPEWVKDAVFYQIFPDRFAKSESVYKPNNLEAWDAPPTFTGFKGGDLMGVAERLDYLHDLGITAIYFNPIFQSAANHRYHTHDYYQVDPLLGGNKAFRHLLDEAHARGIKVILDGVFNHASRGFFQFNHLLEVGQDSPYVDWFHVNEFPLNAYNHQGNKPNYHAWWDLPDLPKFNTDLPAVREFIWDIAEFWVEFGIDGWRLDVPNEINDPAFWQEFRRRVKRANPEAYIVGEIWGEAHEWLQGDKFDAIMNYQLARPAIGFFGGGTLSGITHGGWEVKPQTARTFADALEGTLNLYDWNVTQVQLNLLGSHDTPRFLSIVSNDQTALQLATLCQMTLPGAPCIYYGDELGLQGEEEPACRNTIPWDRLSDYQGDLWASVRQAIALRNAHPVLRRGTYETLLAEGDQLAYRRSLDGTQALVTFNTSHEAATVTLKLEASFTVAYGEPEDVQQDGGTVRMTLPPRSGVVLLAGE